MIAGDAEDLATLIEGTLALLILFHNEVEELGFKRSPDDRIKAFKDYLFKRGIYTNTRKEFGLDIDAACGQLRAKKK